MVQHMVVKWMRSLGRKLRSWGEGGWVSRLKLPGGLLSTVWRGEKWLRELMAAHRLSGWLRPTSVSVGGLSQKGWSREMEAANNKT